MISYQKCLPQFIYKFEFQTKTLLVNFYISDEKCEFLQKSSPYRIFGKKIKILEGKLISAKVISYHFWSNRARTLLTSSVYTDSSPLRAGNLSTLPQEHAFIPGQIRWFTGPSPLSFLFALPMSHAISPFWLYTGKVTFLGESTHFLNQNRSDFLHCTPSENFPSFGANPTSIGWSHLL